MSAQRAAGAVLWRRDEAGRVEVALVHRPRYDDWSLPKGKAEPGETEVDTAVREVTEETGYTVALRRYLRQISYRLPGGEADKVVTYFSAEVTGGEFAANEEVDRLRWLPPEQAAEWLSYPGDVRTLADFRALPAELSTVLLVRHAKAGKREGWAGDDDLRPLAEVGVAQANALRVLLRAFAPDRVHSAPLLRCVQTVAGVAEELGTEVRHEKLLAEDGYWDDPVRGLHRLLAIAGQGGTALVSSQGGVIPDLVATLAERDGVELRTTSRTDSTASTGTVSSGNLGRANLGSGNTVPCKKGSLWLLSFRPSLGEAGRKGPESPAENYTLCATTYVPTALAPPLPRP